MAPFSTMTGPEGLSTSQANMALVRNHILLGHIIGSYFDHSSNIYANNFVIISLFTVQEILTGQRVGIVDAMAYDWTSKVLFWTSTSYKSVVAFKVTDGSRREIASNLIKPKGIAVHPGTG